MSGSGISWAICKTAPRSRQITTPAPHRFLQAGCPSCHPTNSIKALRALTRYTNINEFLSASSPIYWMGKGIKIQLSANILSGTPSPTWNNSRKNSWLNTTQLYKHLWIPVHEQCGCLDQASTCTETLLLRKHVLDTHQLSSSPASDPSGTGWIFLLIFHHGVLESYDLKYHTINPPQCTNQHIHLPLASRCLFNIFRTATIMINLQYYSLQESAQKAAHPFKGKASYDQYVDYSYSIIRTNITEQ